LASIVRNSIIHYKEENIKPRYNPIANIEISRQLIHNCDTYRPDKCYKRESSNKTQFPKSFNAEDPLTGRLLTDRKL